MTGAVRRWAPLAGVLAVAAALYAPSTRGFFCGYDDFHELARAAFEDTVTPAHVLTQPHDDGARYRPVNRAITLAMWQWAGFAPFAYRLRNVLAHLGVVAACYALALRVVGVPSVAIAAALVFGVHPLANQAVNGALWTNTLAYLLCALSLVAALGAGERGARRRVVASVACLVAAAGCYEPTLVTPLLVRAAAVGRPARAAALRRVARAQAAAVLAVAVLHLVVASPLRSNGGLGFDGGARIAAVGLYVGALLSPVDPVLAHVWFGAPWPGELAGALRRSAAGGVLAAVLVGLLAVAVARRRAIGGALGVLRADPALRVLALWLVLALAPFVLFTGHASETYLYFPLAILLMLAWTTAHRLLAPRRRTAYWTAVAAAAAWCAGATVTRNALVLDCGATAARIVTDLPAVVGEAPVVAFADEPADDPPRRYGLYGYTGLHTIGDPPLADRGLGAALQLASGDWRRRGLLVDGDRMARDCGAPASIGVWVGRDGRLRPCAAGGMPAHP